MGLKRAPIRDNPAYDRLVKKLDAIQNTMTGLGTTQDKGQAFSVIYSQRLDYTARNKLYRGNGYARRIIDIKPNDCTRKGWKVLKKESSDDLAATENERLKVRKKVAAAMRWGALHGAGFLFPVIDPIMKTIDQTDLLQQPLYTGDQPPVNILKVKNILVFDATEVTVHSKYSDLFSDKYGEPELYRVNPNGGGGSYLVHETRLIRFDGADLPPSAAVEMTEFNYGDDSILESCFQSICAKTAVDLIVPTLSQEFNQNVMTVADMSALSTSDQADLIDTRIKQISQGLSLLNMVLLGQGETFSNKQITLTGLKELNDIAVQAMSAHSAIPQSLLFGNTPGGLSTDDGSQKRNWNNVIVSEQTDNVGPRLYPLYRIIFAAKAGPTKGEIPEFTIEFNPLDEMSELEKATLRKAHADADAVWIAAGSLAPGEPRSRWTDTGYQNEISLSKDLYTAEAEREAAELLREMEDESVVETSKGQAPSQVVSSTDPAQTEDEVVAEKKAEADVVADVTPPGTVIEKSMIILDRVITGQWPKELAIRELETMYGMKRERAEYLVGGTNGFKPDDPEQLQEGTSLGGDVGT